MLTQILTIIGILLVIFLIVQWFSIESFVPLPQVRRLMSYDIRGDIPIPYSPVSPWNNPEVGPIHNRPVM